ncbi:phage/plasmid replication protein, II/X family [Pseudomonas aeruginosa]|uniref:phage/plasmid replication protein, II/X family n=1 Tax=Pseudomonas aeruginosa TaxID=287 RepID=UPI00333554EE
MRLDRFLGMIDWIAVYDRTGAPRGTFEQWCGGLHRGLTRTVAWETPRKMLVRGSHDSTIHIRSVGGDGQGNATHLYIDGNPSKWLQGHNLVGSCDLVAPCLGMLFNASAPRWALSRPGI